VGIERSTVVRFNHHTREKVDIMSFAFDAPETTTGEGGGLSTPGTYHVVINEVREGESATGKAIDGLTITVEVLDGTTKGMGGKTRSESLFLPSLKDQEKEQQSGQPSMPRKKLAALFIAANAMQPDQLGKPVNVDTSKMVGQQCVIKFEHQMEKDGDGKYTVPTQYIQISYSDIFHVDDPDVSAIPKSAEALGLIPREFRHDAAWFAWKKKKAGANGANGKPAMAGAGATVTGDDIF
jgi:hypothetical protein